jgi:hypothetical protein
VPEIDFEAEGLLEGAEGDRARGARLELLRTLEAEGFKLEELRRATREDRLALLPLERVLEGEGRRYTRVAGVSALIPPSRLLARWEPRAAGRAGCLREVDPRAAGRAGCLRLSDHAGWRGAREPMKMGVPLRSTSGSPGATSPWLSVTRESQAPRTVAASTKVRLFA